MREKWIAHAGSVDAEPPDPHYGVRVASSKTPRTRPSGLVGRVWELELGAVTLTVATRDDASNVDRDWPAIRPATDIHDWSWRRIRAESSETYAIAAHPRARILALFATNAHRLLLLRGVPSYRLDRLEVAPSHRGGTLAPFVVALVAARALEAGAEQLVLSAIPLARALYDATGGEQRLAPGWKAQRGLLPYVYTRAALEKLKEVTDEPDDEKEE